MTLQLGPVIGKVGGAQLEEIPVSMSGAGNGTVYPLTTVDAGDGAIILVAGSLSPGATSAASRPHLQLGTHTHIEPHTQLDGRAELGIGALVTGTAQVAVLSRSFGTTSFTGTVYVARL